MDKNMKARLLGLALILVAPAALASAGHKSCGSIDCDKVKVSLADQASLQRGARIFVNYCLSCHSASYMRYSRMGHDLGISDELVKENLLFAADKVSDPMKAVMSAEDGKKFFGVAPPDLSVIARSRGPNWLYTYLRGFYRDPKSFSGWNNTVFPNVAMPHVLYEWQGEQRAVFDKDHHFVKFELERPGKMSEKEFDEAMRDLTNFLVYLGEPAKLVRFEVGAWTIAFLVVFLISAYLLKKEYWKDVH